MLWILTSSFLLTSQASLVPKTTQFKAWQTWANDQGCVTDLDHYQELLSKLQWYAQESTFLPRFIHQNSVNTTFHAVKASENLPKYVSMIEVNEHGIFPRILGKVHNYWTKFWPEVVVAIRHLLPKKFIWFANFEDTPLVIQNETCMHTADLNKTVFTGLPEEDWVLERIFTQALKRAPILNTMPVFSFCSHPCFADIPVPHHEYRYNDDIVKSVPWENKKAAVYFRGYANGVDTTSIQDQHSINRPRLLLVEWSKRVHLINHLPFTIDIRLITNDREKDPVMTAFENKYVLILDGFAWPDRMTYSLRGGSLLFLNTHYTSWWSQWLQPWVHYVPFVLEPGNSNLTETLLWAVAHDGHAQQIAINGMMLANKIMLKKHMQCYGALALLEYCTLNNTFT